MRPGEDDHENLDGPAPVVVPDDASALEADRLAWLAEQRLLRRRHGWRRLVLTRRWERFGLSGPIVVLCLLATAAVGSLAVAFFPRSSRPGPAAAALATAAYAHVTAASPPLAEPSPGPVVGRLLPAASLAGDVRPVSSTDLRPGVLLLVPPDCGCTDVLGAVHRQAREFRLVTWLVAAPAPGESRAATRARLVELDEDGTGGAARWAVDPSGTLAQALAARGTTLIAVRPDGTVAGLRRDLPLESALLPPLEPLLARLGTVNR